jgi:PAS domain S-box-containing protein
MIVSELYQNEKMFKELFENIKTGVAIYETNDNGKSFIVREMNKAGLEVCEITRKDLLGKNLIDVFPSVDEFGFIDSLRNVWKTGTPEHSPTALYQDDRVYGWTEMYIYRLPSKKVVTIFETQTKLVEAEERRRETEKELERLNKVLEERIKKRSKELEVSEEKYRKLFENSPIAIMEQDYSEAKNYVDQLRSSGITDFEKFFDENPKEVVKLMTKGKVIDVNKKTLEVYKANTKEELISRMNHLSNNVEVNITDEVLLYNKKEYLSFMQGETIFDSEIASKTFTEDTIYLYARTSILPEFESTWSKVVVTLIDITERKIAEEMLKESEEKFKTLADQSLMGIFIIQDNKTIYANQKLADMMDHSFEQIMKMTLEDQLTRIHPDDRKFVEEQAIKKQKGEDNVIYQYQFRYIKESGELMWIEVYSKTIIYGGKPANFVTFVDITNQKKVEEALQKSENEKSAIIESLLEHIVYQTPDNTIIYANKSAADSVNLTPEELIGRKCYEVWNSRDEPCEDCPVIEAIKTKKPAISEMTTPDGRIWYVGSFPVKDKDDNIIGIVESTLDITEKKTAEEKVRKSEEKYRKAYYQANLYRDIFAHDINNILQNISSSVELSSLYLNNPEKLHTIKELYEIVDEQVNRAKKLILNVRKITELDESEINLEKIEANHILKNAIEFLESSFQTRNINIKINSPTKKNYVYADNLLLDVFENILINAVRYNNRSNIEINIDIDKEQKEDKSYIKMEFKDNGVGISDYRKKSIFERGKRKSQKSKGMGLGLSLVKKIMDNYQGEIWVEDRIKGDYKQGCNFIILLPSDS